MNYTKIIQDIATNILEEIKQSINTKSCSDKSFKGKVIKIITPDKCKVIYSGNEYTASTTIYCEVDDIVRICAPCNNWHDLYIVENRTPGKTLRDIYNSVHNK